MPHPTGPTNPELKKLIVQLRKSKVKEYAAIAKILQKPRRAKEEVNLHALEHAAQESTNIIVPWKVLGSGEITKAVRVFSFAFSQKAKEKIIAAGGDCLPLHELVNEEPGHVIVLSDMAEREE